MFGKKKNTTKDTLKNNIQKGLEHMTKAAESFNDIVADETQDQYSKTRAAGIVVILDSCLRLALIADNQPILMASGSLMQYVDSIEAITKDTEQQKEQEQMAKEGKNIITDIPKTIH